MGNHGRDEGKFDEASEVLLRLRTAGLFSESTDQMQVDATPIYFQQYVAQLSQSCHDAIQIAFSVARLIVLTGGIVALLRADAIRLSMSDPEQLAIPGAQVVVRQLHQPALEARFATGEDGLATVAPAPPLEILVEAAGFRRVSWAHRPGRKAADHDRAPSRHCTNQCGRHRNRKDRRPHFGGDRADDRKRASYQGSGPDFSRAGQGHHYCGLQPLHEHQRRQELEPPLRALFGTAKTVPRCDPHRNARPSAASAG